MIDDNGPPAPVPSIFIIDDDDNDIFFARRAIEEIMPVCRIAEASDGLRAIAQLSAGYRPHLILLDLNLPGMDGLEILQHITNHPDTSLIPVAIVSSSGLERDIQRTMAAGAKAYVLKSHDFEEFSRGLRQVLEATFLP